jgi:hypothetical protein
MGRVRPARAAALLLIALGTVLGPAAPGYAAAARLTLGASSGPSGGGNVLTLTAAGAGFTAASTVEFQYATPCTPAYADPVAITVDGDPATQTAGVIPVPSGGVVLLSSGKLAVVVPADLALPAGQSVAAYYVCVYRADGSLQAASTPYKIVGSPLIGQVSPPVGSTQGGAAITVTGGGFAGTLTVTLDGAALSGITAAADGTSFTATVPPHAPGQVPLTVTTAVGSTSATLFTYTNGITVQPATAPGSSTAQAVDITGLGFSGLTFSGPGSGSARVFLVAGAYDPTDQGGVKTVGETAECAGVLVVGDTELICTLDLTHSYRDGVLAGRAARTVTDGVTTAGDTTLSSATADFAEADLNEAVSGPGIPPGTIIASVTGPETAVLSASPVADGTGLTVAIGPREVTDAVLTAGGTTLTSASAGFTTEDTGRVVTSDNLPPNTVITAVTDPGTVELSQPATVDETATVSVAEPVAVPDGTYTMTVVSNAGLDVQPGGVNEDPAYTQSVVSSGSTFTVAAY